MKLRGGGNGGGGSGGLSDGEGEGGAPEAPQRELPALDAEVAVGSLAARAAILPSFQARFSLFLSLSPEDAALEDLRRGGLAAGGGDGPEEGRVVFIHARVRDERREVVAELHVRRGRRAARTDRELHEDAPAEVHEVARRDCLARLGEVPQELLLGLPQSQPVGSQQAPGPYGVGQSKPAYSMQSDPIFSPMGPPSAVRPVTLSRRAVYSGAASSASHATRQRSVQAVGHAPTSPAPAPAPTSPASPRAAR